MKIISVKKQVDGQIIENVYDEVDNKVQDRLRYTISDQLLNPVFNQSYARLWGHVWHRMREQLFID